MKTFHTILFADKRTIDTSEKITTQTEHPMNYITVMSPLELTNNELMAYLSKK